MFKKDLPLCKNIFIDTTVIIDLLSEPHDKRDKVTNERIKFSKSLISYLSSNKTHDNKERHFMMSAISLSEILALDEERQKDLLKAIQIVIGTSNFEVISYTREVAQYHNEIFLKSLTNKQLSQLAKEIDYPKNAYVNFHDRMRKDYLIMATAMYSNSDVVFTGDNAFFKLTETVSLPCVETLVDRFVTSQGGDKYYGFK